MSSSEQSAESNRLRSIVIGHSLAFRKENDGEINRTFYKLIDDLAQQLPEAGEMKTKIGGGKRAR